ncbi:hypothetical protein EMCRGX_G025354 [Ephydatia muelleri]
MFPAEMKKSNVPHFDILRAPIGDFLFCAKYIAQKCMDTSKLLQQLAQVGTSDPHVAMLLLHQCESFYRLIHLTRTIPPSLAGDALSLYDDEVRQCFAECTAVDTPDPAWQQAQLSLTSAIISGLSSEVFKYLHHSIDLHNNLVDPPDSLTPDSVDNSSSPLTQKFLSNKIENGHLVTPSPSVDLHLEPSEFQVAIKWWLSIPVAHGQNCSQCNAALDAFGHHVLCWEVTSSHVTTAYVKPNIVILGVAIGDLDFCSSFITTKRMEARAIISQLEQVGLVDPRLPWSFFISVMVFISSICSSGFGSQSVHHLSQAIVVLNNLVSPEEAITAEAVLLSPPTPKQLSSKLDDSV